MAYSGKLLKINGHTIPGLKEYKVTYAKLWKDAERNMNGDVTASLIGIFPKIELVFRNALTEEDISTITNLLAVPYFSVEFFNPKVKGATSAQYYAGDHTIELLERRRGIFKEFNVSLVPVSKDTSSSPIDPDTPVVNYDDGELERF